MFAWIRKLQRNKKPSRNTIPREEVIQYVLNLSQTRAYENMVREGLSQISEFTINDEVTLQLEIPIHLSHIPGSN